MLAFITMLTSALTCAAWPALPTKRSAVLSFPRIGFTSSKHFLSPPHMRYSVPWRACGMEDAMHPSSVMAPRLFARRPISTWVFGVTVAQLTKVLPLARTRRESPSSAKTPSCAASSVTTVKITSAAAVTVASFAACLAPSSRANAAAAGG